jgi:hypothetical protein
VFERPKMERSEEETQVGECKDRRRAATKNAKDIKAVPQEDRLPKCLFSSHRICSRVVSVPWIIFV